MDIFSEENMGVLGTNPNGTPQTGIYILDATERRNQYDGTQTVGAGYVMTDMQLGAKVKLNVGLRAEFTRMDVRSFSMGIAPGNIEQLDLLPGLNFVYEPLTDMNLRVSYSRTVARPNFREMAPFASFDFNQDNVVVGNPALSRVLSDNADLRWEYYFRPGELVAITGFFKHLQNPIERIFSPVGYNEVTWRNVPSGKVYGLELEVRKRLDFVPALADFSWGANVTLVHSEVDIDPAELARFRAVLGPDYPNTRRLYAQSPFLVNTYLGYANAESGTEANLNFNLFGERLSVVGTGTAPDVFEQPRPMLNCMVGQIFGPGKRFKVTLRANNLLDPKYLYAYKVGDAEVPFQSYRLGREFQVALSYSIK
jgi:TonB-dependent receptor